ncbi:MAG TPA: DUF1569 domain-containing protein [Terracidiphilus sp.]|jgi:hypothetical protein
MKSLNEAGTRQQILERLRKIGPATPRLWGRMNAPQMVCHLSDSFLSVMGEKHVETPRGLNLWPLAKPLALYAPFKWPAGVATRPELDAEVGGTRPTDFAADMAALLVVIDKFTLVPRPFQFRPHPMFGPMTENQWMRWGYLHTDHHLRQFGT